VKHDECISLLFRQPIFLFFLRLFDFSLLLCQELGRAWRLIATSQGQDKAKRIWLWVRTT
jgi:hypothetical protein